MPARHKNKRNRILHNRKLSKITVAMAGIGVIVPVAVVAVITTSGADAGNSSSLLAMGAGVLHHFAKDLEAVVLHRSSKGLGEEVLHRSPS